MVPQNAREFNILNQIWEHKKARFLIPMNAVKVKLMIFARPGSALFIKNLTINCIDRAINTNNSNMKFIAHQGQPLFAPENTLPCFEYTFKGGYDSCVININYTSDNVIVCLHDNTIDRTSNGTGNIHEMTYAEALNYDFGSWFNESYTGTKLPTLEEVLMLFARNGVKPTIRWNTSLSSENTQQVFNLLNKLGLEDNITIISFDIDTLLELKQLKPNYKYGYSGYSPLDETLINKLKQLGDDVYFDREIGTLTQEEVNTCHENGIKVSSWTVNDKVWLYRLIGWGVDAIKTDTFCLQNCNI
jgi:glycerophosphoryl diester phosphodiesterase